MVLALLLRSRVIASLSIFSSFPWISLMLVSISLSFVWTSLTEYRTWLIAVLVGSLMIPAICRTPITPFAAEVSPPETVRNFWSCVLAEVSVRNFCMESVNLPTVSLTCDGVGAPKVCFVSYAAFPAASTLAGAAESTITTARSRLIACFSFFFILKTSFL